MDVNETNPRGPLTGKVALITGGTSGIGEATAERFVAAGAQVVLAGRSQDKGAAVAARLGAAAVYCPMDVMEEGDIAAAVRLTVDRFGALDILFNNAGGPTSGSLTTFTGEQIDYGVHLLLSSVIFGIKHAVPHMEARGGGSIINCSSIAGIRYNQGNILYSVLKAAVTHYTRLAAVELGPKQIRVNAISPADIETDMTASFTPEIRARLIGMTPLGRFGVVEEVVGAAVYLAADESSYVTGQTLAINGGLFMS